MAGSYRHAIDGWSMIENMGDAYECVEELLWLIESKIGRDSALIALEDFYAIKRGDVAKDEAMIEVESSMSR